MSHPLKISHATTNNLKSISLEIPHDSLVAVTGLSGSGKSSLAFDTVYAEGQRRYVETFSPYTRQFLDKTKKPDADLIDHVRPAIAIQQRVKVSNSRSTVGSMTNINDYLKVIWAALSEPHCPECDSPLKVWSVDSLSKHLEKIVISSEAGTFIIAYGQRLEGTKKAQRAEIDRLMLLGFNRFFNPETKVAELLEETERPTLTEGGLLLLVLDRLKGGAVNKKRLREVISQAFARPDPHLLLLEVRENAYQQSIFRPTPFCEQHPTKLERCRPALFSFNHPFGACPSCKGFGRIITIERERCVPNHTLSIKDHAIDCWKGEGTRIEYRELLAFCAQHDIPTDVPWSALTEKHRELIFTSKTKSFWGILPWFTWLERKSYKMHVRVFLSRYRTQIECPECHGTRLRRDARAYRIEDLTLPDLWKMPMSELYAWVKQALLSHKKIIQSSRELEEALTSVRERIEYLIELGLPYLTLDRQARTLSGGETQRVNLAAALGSSLTSTHFVLDEPSVGLHPRDTRRLIAAVKRLRDRGNSVLVVEHDLDCINAADHIIELGPKAGVEGGEVVYNGPQAKWGGVKHAAPSLSARPAAKHSIKIQSAHARNLKSVTVDIPLERLVVLSGVSGSGKSSLVHEVLSRYYDEKKNGRSQSALVKSVTGLENISELVVVDQSALSKTPRANIATYSGVWDTFRALLADTQAAQKRALTKSSFSFNVDGGRCPHCKGAGFIREDMQFLSDCFIPCDVCLGKRFQQPVLDVLYRDLNADQILSLNIDACMHLFSDIQSIVTPCEILSRLGLGHLTLGHPLSELSGGEAQRLKLVPYLEKSPQRGALLVFDEPTTGLHLYDVQRLISLFQTLIARGNSVLCIEHNLEVIGHADWLIDLGPEGGDGGGTVMCEGRPEELLRDKKINSETIRYLKEYLHSSARAKEETLPVLSSETVFPAIEITGAHEHNLKNISLSIPLGQVVALTGVSGSGKSTVAKDIVYAEGQRRYLDCLSPYARQFIKELKRPDVVKVSNIPPTICVYQHTFQPGALSTVGTMSEAYNFLRLLYAKTATQFCPSHRDQAIAPASSLDIARAIRQIDAPLVRILAPAVKAKKGLHKEIFERALRSEISEVRVDGIFAKPSHFEKGLVKSRAHSIDYVIAKFNPSRMSAELIEEAVIQGLSISGGTLLVHYGSQEQVFSSERTCPICHTGFFKPDPEDLSFSSKRGACPTCEGTGLGRDDTPCSSCHGERIKPAGRNLRLEGHSITQLCNEQPNAIAGILESLSFAHHHQALAEPIIRELLAKLKRLENLSLDYLPLNRDCSTLSGGELQRLRLATAIGSPLAGVLYIFDEPSIGLHPLDNGPVIESIQSLKESGNSVILIEHDTEMIRSSDYVIEIGPGGGKNGGEIVFTGAMSSFLSAETATARALTSQHYTSESSNPQKAETFLYFSGSKNNIKTISGELPLNRLVTVAGVSGAGKSSLVHGIIAETIRDGRKIQDGFERKDCRVTASSEILEHVIEIDQKPIGANSRSTPASYLGIWDEVRKLFAAMVEAKTRGWNQSFFSYNTGKGRCPECKGLGSVTFEMTFLPDARIECESCQGKRFTEDALTVTYQGLTISEVLALTFEQALSIFAAHRKIHRPIHHVCELGLGYLSLGQSSTTLSGGEAQRLKLASEISSPRSDHTIYIFDEPTVGLHRSDVQRLLTVLRSLVGLGHSAIVIEHDGDIIRSSDYVLEIGPGPAERGGSIIFAGAPNALCKAKTPWGDVLRKQLNVPKRQRQKQKELRSQAVT